MPIKKLSVLKTGKNDSDSSIASSFNRWGHIRYRSKFAFGMGCLMIVVGALLHLPMFLMARNIGFKLAGMPMDYKMLFGMLLIIIGIPIAAWGISPPRCLTNTKQNDYAHIQVKAFDRVSLSKFHIQIFIALSVALIIDIMKPATIAFVIPGSMIEYDISQWTVALLPLSALTGTAVGSLAWGWLGDRIGRRACILLSAMMFMGSSICGAMPTFNWNLLMCFIMGLSAGGLLPVATALLAEILPSRSRAPALVLLSGIGAVGGYIAAAGCAALLEPHFGWRVMWFLNLPTGLILILMNHYIPESPRFLFSQGRDEEAEEILKALGCEVVGKKFSPLLLLDENVLNKPAIHNEAKTKLFSMPYLPYSLAIILYGLAWGLVNYGFLMWLPANLRDAGFTVYASNALLAHSALIAFPAIFLVAWLYTNWSTKNSLILYSFLTATALFCFIPLAYQNMQHVNSELTLLLIILLISSSGMTMTLMPYSSEIFPTHVRALGSGLAAGSGKLGGVVGIMAVVAHVEPTLIVSACLVAIPVLLALLTLLFHSVETRGHSLEEASTLIINRKKRLGKAR